jgi:hypothetical protein
MSVTCSGRKYHKKQMKLTQKYDKYENEDKIKFITKK